MMFSTTNGHRIRTATAAGVLRMTMPRPKPSRLTITAKTTMPISAGARLGLTVERHGGSARRRDGRRHQEAEHDHERLGDGTRTRR